MPPTADVSSSRTTLVSPSASAKLRSEPLQKKGVLDQFRSFDVTPVIGREFPDVQLTDLLNAENKDELIRDLAITVSERGVVFFRNQSIEIDQQKELANLLGHLTDKPAESGLHIHPVSNGGRGDIVNERGDLNKDNEVSVISSERRLTYGWGDRKFLSDEWHSDITFEPVPADYSILKVHTLPETGGDTLWASGYEVYDRISAPVRAFLDTLTATYAQPKFNETAARAGFELYTQPRGSPLNVGEVLEAKHPVVRTNPVTGWKSIFGFGHHVSHLDGLTPFESEKLLKYFEALVVHNHDLQVRLKWNKNDLAIWDNRSVYHAATPDYDHLGKRTGARAVGVGEKPYLDPASTSRREALAAKRAVSTLAQDA